MSWVIVASAATAAIAGSMQADAINNNARINRDIDNLNAGYANLDAYNAVQTGDAKAARYQDTINQTVGEQKVAMASKNVDVNFGTGAQIQAQTKLTGYLNQLDIQRQASQRSMGYKTQSLNLQLQGQAGVAQAGINANAAQVAGYARAASTMIGEVKPQDDGFSDRDLEAMWREP